MATTTTDPTLMAQAAAYAEPQRAAWISAWPDVLAFVGTLVLAWRGHWAATDLVWSLWLSSLVVGYALIVWTIARPIVAVVRGWQRDPSGVSPAAAAAMVLIMTAGGLLVLAFFTVHFGMFHYVHSQFLASFFPVPGADAHLGSAGTANYRVVLRRYWRFLPAAFLAERGAFLKPASFTVPAAAARAGDPSGAKGRPKPTAGGAMWEPYRNVVRMHALIFFFAFAHFARLDNFAVYAVIYAAYFLPWRLMKREG